MELTYAKYRVVNHAGSNIVSADEARRAWESWDPEHRTRRPDGGFTVWDVYSDHPDQILMTTSYIPIPDTNDQGEQ